MIIILLHILVVDHRTVIQNQNHPGFFSNQVKALLFFRPQVLAVMSHMEQKNETLQPEKKKDIQGKTAGKQNWNGKSDTKS